MHEATCVIVAGLVYRSVLPHCGEAQAAQYDTPGPKLRYKLRRRVLSVVVYHVVMLEIQPHSGSNHC